MALINPATGEIQNAKRGRPAKNAPVYDDDGTLLLTSDQHERINELIQGIKADGEKVEKLLLSAAEKYYVLGEILYVVQARAVGRMTAKKYSEKTGIPERMIYTSLKVYSTFANEPDAISNLTMRELAMLIGEKKEKEGLDNGNGKVVSPLPEGQLSFMEDSFGLPTESGIELKKYRLHSDAKTGMLYLLSKDFNAPLPVANLTVAQPTDPVMESAYKQLMTDTQIAMEKYYSVIEREQEANDD